MSGKARFKIRRKDRARLIDDAPLAGEELKIGRDLHNNLVLNDPAVSPLHAIIRLKNGKLWLFDVFDTNATLLNGIIIPESQLCDKDVIRIGPFFLLIDFDKDDFIITVERELKVVPVKAPVNLPSSRAAGLRHPVRLAGINDEEREILEIIWETRQREAGKVVPKTPLHPAEQYKTGKLRYKWRATRDLKPGRRVFHLAWTVAIVLLASLAGLYLYKDIYSPGDISTAHASPEIAASTIALRACSNSCSNCHKMFGNMQDNCSACHNVARKAGIAISGFDPGISAAHRRANIGCVGCHSEHRGASFKPGDVNNRACTSCHNEQYNYNGKILGTPHKKGSGEPSVGYIRKGDTVEWRTYKGQDAIARFHADHPYAKDKCSYCHDGTRGTEKWKRSPVAACETCHAVSFTAASPISIGPNCATCHKQHGINKDLKVALESISSDKREQISAQLKSGGLDSLEDQTDPFTPATIGGESIGRQGDFTLGLGLIEKLGSIPWYIWLAVIVILPLCGVVVMAASDRFRVGVISIANRFRRRFLKAGTKEQPAEEEEKEKATDGERAAKVMEPDYPHPKIDPEKCIACYLCLDACPQDVLAMSYDAIATPVALDQCMDDTSCQVACPTGACVVINTQRKIPQKEKPDRDTRTYVTNVPGLYLIGELSRAPFIKNAIDEGSRVMNDIEKDESLQHGAEYDVVIIGGGPAGLSAALAAEHKKLKYVLIEQDTILSTIQSYPVNKAISFNPDAKKIESRLTIPTDIEQRTKETILLLWSDISRKAGIEIREKETCKEIKKNNEMFTVTTEKIDTGEKDHYVARKVILATGNGMPRKLDKSCPHCGEACKPKQTIFSTLLDFMTKMARLSSRKIGRTVCSNCGKNLPDIETEARIEGKVKYGLSDAAHFENKKCIVIGAGNSAVEAAVALTGFERNDDEIKFTRTNDVTLVIRSDFKSDLKFVNKMNVYDCKDAKKIKIYFETEVKEIKEHEVILMNKKKEEIARIPNDYVFVRIGGEWPKSFLTESGIKIITGNESA